MRILVTGHKGFVGSALSAYLRGLGHDVSGLDLPTHDITWPNDIGTVVREEMPEIVVHCAAVADLNISEADPDWNFRVNVVGTWNVAVACKRANIKMLFISTCCVYGDCRDEIETEDSLPRPTELYAASKLADEYVIQCLRGLDYMIARIGTVYGPGMRPALFNFIVIDNIARGRVVQIHGDGAQTRNYVYISDLVAGLSNLICKWTSRDVVNICGSESTSVMDTIDIASRYLREPVTSDNVPDRAGQISRENISNEKSRKIYGCSYIPYSAGMMKTVMDYIAKTAV